jgi:uncharacterized protein
MLMSKFYSADHRVLQDRFETRRMADLMEGGIVHTELGEPEVAFIEARDMFFLSTIDPSGRPTVSYKGGAPGLFERSAPRDWRFRGTTEMACTTRLEISWARRRLDCCS